MILFTATLKTFRKIPSTDYTVKLISQDIYIYIFFNQKIMIQLMDQNQLYPVDLKLQTNQIQGQKHQC